MNPHDPLPDNTAPPPPDHYLSRYVKASRYADHVLAPLLGPWKCAVLRAVLDTTLGSGRECCGLSLSAMAGRCGMSRESVQRVMVALLSDGYLVASRKPGTARILSFCNLPPAIMPLRRPRPKAATNSGNRCLPDNTPRQSTTTNRCLPDNSGDAEFAAPVEKTPTDRVKLRPKKGKGGDDLDLIHKKKEGSQDQKLQSSPDRFPSEALARVESMVKAASEKRGKAKESAGSIGKRARWAWVRVCSNSHQADCLLKKDVVILHQYAKRTAPRLDVLALLEWCLSNWTQIVAERFAWMKTNPPPDLPSVRFFVAQAEKFEQAFRERGQLEALAGMTDKERLIAKARRKGMTQQAAERHAEDMLGLTHERAKLEAERKAIALERRRLAFTTPELPAPTRPVYLTPSAAPSEFGEFED